MIGGFSYEVLFPINIRCEAMICHTLLAMNLFMNVPTRLQGVIYHAQTV